MMARHRRRRTLLERLRDRGRERVEADLLVRRWERFRTAPPRGRFVRTPAPHVRPHVPMPGPCWILNPGVRACYDRLWDRALIVAERKLHGVVLP